jgi:cyclic beta-1,2-glucan synthetase
VNLGKLRPSVFLSFEDPIRSEIFSTLRLEQHAESLARAQAVTKNPRRGRSLDSRTKENAWVLKEAYNELLHSVEEKRAITPAAEWLIDNFHIVRAQLKDIKEHLPPAYYRELPKIAEGPLAGLPRVYGIAWAFVAHTDSRFDPDLLKIFLGAYQKVQPLTIGELWALPITLRLVLIENLRRIAARLIGSQRMRIEADAIADSLLGVGEVAPRKVEDVVSSLKSKTIEQAFAVQILQRLRFQEARVGALLSFIDDRLATENKEIESLVSTEHAAQASANVTVRNIITSARLMSSYDWTEFFEAESCVDTTLREGSRFAEMDFVTRDRYRHAIEDLARRSPLSEIEIAKRVIEFANANQREPGYYLIDDGREEFESLVQFQPNVRQRLTRFYLENAAPLYLGTIAALTFVLGTLVFMKAFSADMAWVAAVILGACVLLLASEIAIAIVNRLTVAVLGPKHLPRLKYANGLPEECRTFIVVPTMITTAERIREQLEQLEVHYLANQDPQIYLALLTDFTDARTETTDHDEHILRTADHELEILNSRHPVASGEAPRFSIYHRRRLFNRAEDRWMGWERKRGKLQEFNSLLLGSTTTSYLALSGEALHVPSGVRYVITLDADTKLPRGSAAQLVGTMSHPLNKPTFDPARNCVVHGYGILQPRVTPSLPSSQDTTIFQRLSTGRSGIDPYASAVSDVYQDLFGEGSFTGKGIYEVEAFERALKGRIPENSVLSHDLLEGNYARCGFLSDVEFFEDFPSHIGVAAMRTHRWTRGDWQLLPWIFGRRGQPISVIGHWKMFDNLRRSLVAPATLLLFFLALMIDDVVPWPLMTLIGLGLSYPALITLWGDLWPKRRNVPLLQHLSYTFDEFASGFERFILAVILLPYATTVSIDAIARATFRLFVSRKKMLEWTTAAQSKAAASLNLSVFVKSLRFAIGAAVAGGVLTFIFSREYFPFTLPPVILWCFAPALAQYFSRPPKKRILRPLRAEDVQLLQSTARRTWRFFATFVTAEENWLPPDNFQEDPLPVVAHRSSPTNFGLYLLSTLAAMDFGWIGRIETAERIENTLKTLMKLPRHRGHFFNWYETTGARPLEPRYISSVDNGNLTGHLYAVVQGLEEILESPLQASAFNRGSLDTLLLLEQEMSRYAKKYPNAADELTYVTGAFSELASRLFLPDHLISDRLAHWELTKTLASALVKQARTFVGDPAQPGREEILSWARALQNDVHSTAADFLRLQAWSEFATETFADATLEDRYWWESVRVQLERHVSITELPAFGTRLVNDIVEFKKSRRGSAPAFLDTLLDSLEDAITESRALVGRIQESQRICRQLAREMDFKLLYDPVRKLFSIGMRVPEDELDPSYYDLLASEARLTSFIAIAKGDIPVSHWFSLGRTLVNTDVGSALVSWSGSMFEYLMPSIVMRNPEGSLLDETCKRAVLRQIEYGTEKQTPWGISESAYNKRDFQLTYQYSNFGLPDLGLKRGLGADHVVAPYATLLASMYEPTLAAENLQAMQAIGGAGPYGYYEAIDFTPSRLPEGRTSAVVKCYMAHHQGMGLVALANIFKNQSMQRRFHADPAVQATELLLQERTPRTIGTLSALQEPVQIDVVREHVEHVARKYHTVDRPVPTTQLLSNGEYTVMISSAGAGFSRSKDMSVTRWREDATRDHYGQFIYLKDVETKNVWSAGYQPVGTVADSYEVSFAEDRARIVREDFEIVSELEVFVSSEENAEVRRLSLTNKSTAAREIEVTSYGEVVLTSHNADVAHPAFQNLFIETEFKADLNALIASRRPRSNKDKRQWMMHVLKTDRFATGRLQYETDRAAFIGRNRSPRNPQAIFEKEKLSGTVGPVLDPIVSLRTRVKILPGVTAHLTFATGVAETRMEIEMMAEKYNDPAVFTRVSDLAWTQAQVKLYHLGIEPDEAHLFQRLTSRLIYSDPSLRPSPDLLKRNVKDVTGLWAHGISGDHPIMLVRIDDIEERSLVRQLLKAQVYLGTKRFICDLVILNEKANSYAQELQQTLEAMAKSIHTPHGIGVTAGKVFVLRGDMLSQEDHVLLAAEARASLSSRLGSLSDQVKRTRMRPIPHLKMRAQPESRTTIEAPKGLQLFNTRGGFSSDGLEYVIVLKGDDTTPAPWINVIANENFGFIVTESGGGYTWNLNSRENQLTPWSNDPVCDPNGEAIILVDRDSGARWSPTAAPIRVPGATYVTSHGQGYSRFETMAFGLHTELTQFVMQDSPMKLSRLVIENRGGHARKISVNSFAEWNLGFSRAQNAPATITEFDHDSRALFAWNPRNNEHGTKIAFSAILGSHSSYTCDRTEFIGRNSSLCSPAALINDEPLSGRSGAGLDPCAALQTRIEIPAGEKIEVVFALGQAVDRNEARRLLTLARQQHVETMYQGVRGYWDRLLMTVQVETPDRSFDLVMNRWFLYQTFVCRIFARAAFYQAGGAFGFRDQLQDVMAVLHSAPDLARQQILRAAARQFVEGDVQHWWHPPFGRGVRTHFSDDLLWLPYVVSEYMRVTGDRSILRESVTFLEGPLLRPDQEDSYYTPAVSHQSASIYEHCARAIDHSLKVGVHGLPLMGAGDWNDGMNHVGLGGKGESVWLAMFMYVSLENFAKIAETESQFDRSEAWLLHSRKLKQAVESQAWDGDWYRRAFFDDGTPLGTAQGEECRIDSLSQSWAVISGMTDPARARHAMQAVNTHLVKPEAEIIELFTPPFDKTPLDPGYIKGYLPGVRENGGQYTHAASWVVIAAALLGDRAKAYELFSFLNPVHHSKDSGTMNRYKIEPYVLAGDVYSQAPHVGRGGWSWYTGSSGWMYRAGLEFILGFSVTGGMVSIKPCVPLEWQAYIVTYRFGKSSYRFVVSVTGGAAPETPWTMKLVDDGHDHEVAVKF